MGRINIELPENVHKELKVKCAIQGVSIKDYINGVLKERVLKTVK